MSRRTKMRTKPKEKVSHVPLGIQEPSRESLLDVLTVNLSHAKRNIYVNRIIYLGEHSFETEESTESVNHLFKTIVQDINDSYCDEPLTGVFVHYKTYFIHMLEGSETSLMKHFQLLMEHNNYKQFSKIKVVVVVNHINQRFINDWIDLPGRPATLLEKLDPDSDMEKSERSIFTCIQKVYQLCTEIRKEYLDPDESDLFLSARKSLDITFYEEVLKAFYPEINLLQFLVQTIYLKDLEDYVSVYGRPLVSDTYDDDVWPIPSTMIPYTIFDKPEDPCVDLPTHKVEEEDIALTEDEYVVE